MNIVSGDFTGLSSHLTHRQLPKETTAIEISDGFLCHRRIRIPEDIANAELIAKDVRRTQRQLYLALFLAMTLFGLPLALYIALFQRQTTVAIQLKTLRGEHFVLLADGEEWQHLKSCCYQLGNLRAEPTKQRQQQHGKSKQQTPIMH
ncbi:hypothetical protein ACFSJ3_00215 [Corallincola platygyrae]|uniref:Uncharacterized protein n=1 Tax=Corallincola platygyrae TaxID=1193278 RepID=A0ABW4XHZ4_9GAMM